MMHQSQSLHSWTKEELYPNKSLTDLHLNWCNPVNEKHYYLLILEILYVKELLVHLSHHQPLLLFHLIYLHSSCQNMRILKPHVLDGLDLSQVKHKQLCGHHRYHWVQVYGLFKEKPLICIIFKIFKNTFAFLHLWQNLYLILCLSLMCLARFL